MTPHVYPALWFTSNTPITTGQRDCAYLRWLGYHAGPHGTGYRRKGHAVPLATGSAVHVGHQLIGDWILEWQAKNPTRRLTAVPDPVIAWAAGEAASQYEASARAKGLILTVGDLDAAAAIDGLILEQRTLIEGLIWIYAIVRLPVMLADYRLLAVEQEEGPVLDCTCGLGDWVGQWDVHQQRGCAGIVAQGRTDALWEGASDATTGTIVYEELKTKASERKSWEDAWEHASQLWLNMEAAGKRLGRDVTTAFVPVLFKGWRGRDRGADPSQPKYQHSPLCYGWYDAGNVPLREPNWSSRYTWHDDYGQKHTLGRTYTRKPLWSPEIEIPTIGAPATASRVERWIKGYITPVQYGDLLKVLGPFPLPRNQVRDATIALLAEERRWRDLVAELREAQAFTPDHPLVAELVPRSWNCTRYDGTPCEGRPICKKEPGWDAIDTMGVYDIRTPHHDPEKVAFAACGVTFPNTDAEEIDGDDA